ncbi:Abi family protein [Lactobacillus delbrueckii]|uniref:Abi family protein n=1 Tax=Lactobacillus delbrueckii TaxID=1584 RepID=UPI0022EC120B|nr:Abi family protein [Lactobacillus delbrueckii]MDA3795842.1 Abi family protein [Lactobacillus delbrueckii]
MHKKEFKSIDQQIDLLQERGLTINDVERAKKYLLSNNYYNIINGYSKPFLESENLYIKNASFDEVSRLYFFDKELKQVLFNSILDAEHHLKSILAHRFAEAHPNNPKAYLDINSYNHKKSLSVAHVISSLNNILRKNRQYRNNSINHYLTNYNAVPIWVIIDYLTFGDLYSFLNCLPDNLQNRVANDCAEFIVSNNPNFTGQFPPKTMLSFIKNIQEIRNVCAHNNRLIYFECRSDTSYFPAIHSHYGITPEDNRRSVYSTFINLQCFVSKVEYAKLHNSIRKKVNTLNNQLKSIDINSILLLLGFPKNWNGCDKKGQQSNNKKRGITIGTHL